MMKHWIAYFSERFSPLISMTVIIGIAFSGGILDSHFFHPFPFVVSCFTMFYLAFLLRLNNDLKDFDKDRIAHPERPLPRGLVSRKEVKEVLAYMQYGLIGYFALIMVFFMGATRFTLLITTGYLWLLLQDFYAADWLERHPLVKGISRQAMIFPLTFLVISFGRPEGVFSFSSFAYVLLLFGAFSTYDICRKLDPFSHPISLAYIHYYGFRQTFWIASIMLLFSAVGAFNLGVNLWLWPCEFVVWLCLLVLFLWPKAFRAAEMASALSLVVHAWAGALQHI